jgi:rhodanese-related sulfurtransferase
MFALKKLNLKLFIPIIIIGSFFIFRYYKANQAKKALGAISATDTIQFIDVRTRPEFESFSINGSLNIPLQEIESRVVEINKDTTVVVFCASGVRSSSAKKVLQAKGFTKVIDAGGIKNVSNYLKERKKLEALN